MRRRKKGKSKRTMTTKVEVNQAAGWKVEPRTHGDHLVQGVAGDHWFVDHLYAC